MDLHSFGRQLGPWHQQRGRGSLLLRRMSFCCAGAHWTMPMHVSRPREATPPRRATATATATATLVQGMKVALVISVSLACVPTHAADSHGDSHSPLMSSSQQETPQHWVELLDADSYATRKKAFTRLWSDATHPDRTPDARRAVIRSLTRGLNHESLEVRCQSLGLIRQIEQAAIEDQINRLLNPHADAAAIDLQGWQSFAKLVGDDRASRQFYAKLYQAQARRIEHWLGPQVSAAPVSTEAVSATMNRLPYTLPSDDLENWALLLFADSLTPRRTHPDLSIRVMMSLAHSNLGPDISATADGLLMKRLIEAWLVHHPEIGSMSDQLTIAMRYGCKPLATRLCQRILEDHRSPAAWQTTAVLSASVLCASSARFSTSDFDAILISRLDDKRTAAVWQMVPSRKTKIQTQVCDVAMAMLLHRHKIDPRQAGFVELQAHPTLIYRDHSIGFGDEHERQLAHRHAVRLLSEIGFEVTSRAAHPTAAH